MPNPILNGSLRALLFVFILLASLFGTPPGQSQAEEQAYRVRLTAGKIDLLFPDGSVLSTPEGFDGTSLKALSASGGMARDLLAEVREQFRLGIITTTCLPRAFTLLQNSPNPLNPSTTIGYTVASLLGPQPVSLTVFNLRGQPVRSLVDQHGQDPGEYSVVWDGRDDHGRALPGGVYLYRLRAGDFNATRKMVLLK